MKIQVYATYCARCLTFEKNLEGAIKELNLDEKIEKIDLDTAIKMNIRTSPTLIIDDEIKSSGDILSVEELKKILKESM
ncbi:thioredoxin family protein [Methanobacterium oryzae]|uniref:thioredoxin family protein n=1 Tax=Methanobacterium oryzae TaxID=69540 RepID=UPI003D206098